MAAYMIVLAHVRDRTRFLEEYAKPAARLVAEHGGEYVLRAPGALALENADSFGGASVVVSRWPDRAAIERFWSSDSYQALKSARQGLAEAHVLVVEEPA